MYYLPGIALTGYFILTAEEAAPFNLMAKGADGITYVMFARPMLNGQFALSAGTINMPILSDDLFNFLKNKFYGGAEGDCECCRWDTVQVSCGLFEDHTNGYHQIVQNS